MYYGPDIMLKAGITVPGLDEKTSSLLLNIPLSGLNAIGTTLAIFFIDRLGRRYIMLRSLPLIALSWIVTAFGMSMTGEDRDEQTQKTGGIVAVLGVSFFLLSFSFGMSSTPWAINAEIYPLHVIGTANSLSAATNWLVNAVVAELFKVLTGISVAVEVCVYGALAVFAILCFIFVYYLIPETANKPIDENVAEILGAHRGSEKSHRKNDGRNERREEDDGV